VGITASLLRRPRVTAFVAVGVVVCAWFLVAPHLARLSLWPAILLVSIVIIPVTLSLVLIALPLYDRRWLKVVEDIYNWHYRSERYLRNSSLATVSRWTSSGPSASRSTRVRANA